MFTRVSFALSSCSARARFAIGAALAAACAAWPSAGAAADATGPSQSQGPAGRAGLTTGLVYGLAGTGERGFAGDGGPATDAHLSGPAGVAVDRAGGVLIADSGNHRVRRVSLDGIITTVAGNGRFGFAGDGGPATHARLRYPTAVSAQPDGGFLIVDSFRVRRVAPNGVISTVAGNGSTDEFGDGGPATAAGVAAADVAALPDGGFLIAGYRSIRRVSPDGVITTVVGYTDYGPRCRAEFAHSTQGVVMASDGADVMVAVGGRICRFTPDGQVSQVADLPRVPDALAVERGGTLAADADRGLVYDVPNGGPARRIFGALVSAAPDVAAVDGERPLGALSGRINDIAVAPGRVLLLAESARDGGRLPLHSDRVLAIPWATGPRLLVTVVAGSARTVGPHRSVQIQLTRAASVVLTVRNRRGGRVRVRARLRAGRHRLPLPSRLAGPADFAVVARAGAAVATAHATLVIGGYLDDDSAARVLGDHRRTLPGPPRGAARLDEFFFESPDFCLRMGPRRVDCEFVEHEESGPDSGDPCAWVQALVLGDNGVIRARTYRCQAYPRQPFRRSPHWNGAFFPVDMRALASPGTY
jgi:hypothetical protein